MEVRAQTGQKYTSLHNQAVKALERDIHDPVQSVLDRPMSSNRMAMRRTIIAAF
jgi:hypothetical protein